MYECTHAIPELRDKERKSFLFNNVKIVSKHHFQRNTVNTIFCFSHKDEINTNSHAGVKKPYIIYRATASGQLACALSAAVPDLWLLLCRGYKFNFLLKQDDDNDDGDGDDDDDEDEVENNLYNNNNNDNNE